MNNAKDICEQIEQDCKRFFPNSYVKFSFDNDISPSIHGRFTLFTEYTNKIIHNDPCFFNFFIYGFDKDGNIKGDLEVDGNAGSIMVKSNNPRYAFERVKTHFRKKNKARVEQVLDYFENFFKKLRVIVNENIERIPTPWY